VNGSEDFGGSHMPPPSTSHYGGATSYNQSNMSDFDAEDLLQDID